MKRIVLLLLCSLVCMEAFSQSYHKVEGYLMYFQLDEKGDTVFMESLDPAWCFPKGRKMKKNDWRRKHKLVYNFNKVYPLALVGRKMMAQVDSTIAADVSRGRERRAYTGDVQRELFNMFEKDIRKMTYSQGAVLLKLIDRECGMSAYEIIKTYRSGVAAAFWQGVAWILGGSLKAKYDPNGADRDLEFLVKVWDRGEWNSFYYSIFYEYPRRTPIPYDRLKSSVKSREKDRKAREAAKKR